MADATLEIDKATAQPAVAPATSTHTGARAAAIQSQMDELRSKYSGMAEERDRRMFPVMPKAPSTATSNAPSTEQSAAAVGPPRSKICPTCGGSGVETSMYNHQVRERTCRGCEGEGVVMIEAKSSSKEAGDAPAATASAEDDVPPLM